jgi:hypothetical protein
MLPTIPIQCVANSYSLTGESPPGKPFSKSTRSARPPERFNQVADQVPENENSGSVTERHDGCARKTEDGRLIDRPA